jgi:hypothetical protein
MVKVYQVEFDVNNFRSLAADDVADARSILSFECKPKLPRWKPPSMYCPDPLSPAPDFWYIGGGSGIAVSSAAFPKVQTQFEMAGELLPLPFEGGELTLLNVLVCINCLDHDKCTWVKTKDGRRLFPNPYQDGAYVFHPDRFAESTLFKIPEMHKSTVLCIEREDDPETEFKAAVEHHKLTGLAFKELWASG